MNEGLPRSHNIFVGNQVIKSYVLELAFAGLYIAVQFSKKYHLNFSFTCYATQLPKYYDASFPIKVVGNFFIGLLTIKTWPNYDVFGLFQHLKSR